ncbi:sensor histidine kinase [Jiella pelagia]|uniref:histidine kinase n=1 Tax=Jiella pelagia TaxID=2986949 RepID=A0ABY7C4P8_9HYPH|nr:ATP-binding protein [Jiella pelagia]WAP71054.1 ATP-binding protein [Jiella pelagia]
MRHAPAPCQIVVTVARSADRIHLCVADNGPGVPFEERDRIFRRLHRLDRSRTTSGSGLGLALVAAIAELHDGRVEALDNGPGLRVRIELPAASAAKSGGNYERV